MSRTFRHVHYGWRDNEPQTPKGPDGKGPAKTPIRFNRCWRFSLAQLCRIGHFSQRTRDRTDMIDWKRKLIREYEEDRDRKELEDYLAPDSSECLHPTPYPLTKDETADWTNAYEYQDD